MEGLKILFRFKNMLLLLVWVGGGCMWHSCGIRRGLSSDTSLPQPFHAFPGSNAGLWTGAESTVTLWASLLTWLIMFVSNEMQNRSIKN